MGTVPEERVLLELVEVSKSYGAEGNAVATQVLKSIHLQLLEGETIGVIGPSGSGKSTLLNIIGALDRPSSGRVFLNGKDLSTLSERELARVRASEMGFVFQSHHLLPQCTVLENVMVPTLAGWEKNRVEEPKARALRLLQRVGLLERLSHRPGQLSGGERQRVAVVRALINEPKLLLADEPTGSLDRAAAENLADLLVELNREEGVALVVVTHTMSLAARMGRVFELQGGALVEVAA
jgi:ABC-type lipoprotein export system ATPase subunit